ncbi:hypothetical protein HY988_04930 [Candidatus Micrarchaeota archaeon]|nr:hypothetical protein [Candidatus Micrarchaeota archaeon]
MVIQTQQIQRDTSLIHPKESSPSASWRKRFGRMTGLMEDSLGSFYSSMADVFGFLNPLRLGRALAAASIFIANCTFTVDGLPPLDSGDFQKPDLTQVDKDTEQPDLTTDDAVPKEDAQPDDAEFDAATPDLILLPDLSALLPDLLALLKDLQEIDLTPTPQPDLAQKSPDLVQASDLAGKKVYCNTLTPQQQSGIVSAILNANGVMGQDKFDYALFQQFDPKMKSVRLVTGDCASQKQNPGKPVFFWITPPIDLKGITTIRSAYDPNNPVSAMIYDLDPNAVPLSSGYEVFPYFIDGTKPIGPNKSKCNATCMNQPDGTMKITNPNPQPNVFALVSLGSFGPTYSVTTKASFQGASMKYDAYVGFFAPGGSYSIWGYTGPAAKFMEQYNGMGMELSVQGGATDGNSHVFTIRRNAQTADYLYDGGLIKTLAVSYPVVALPIILQVTTGAITATLHYQFAEPTVSPKPTTIGPTETLQ